MKEIISLGLFLAFASAIAAGMLAFTYTSTYDRIVMEKQKEIESAKTEILAGQKGKVVEALPKGYAGNINMLVGIDENNKVTGVKIITMNETPGLGANAADANFLRQFIGKSQSDRFVPKEDIQALTGATITSRAVCNGVKEAFIKGSQAPQK
ncbi:MAG: electron transport complex protein RnfG [Candidatus Saganbacteria bacterium]|uniref:Ion-translocating oxidoreductase complex subunit G n=1 Tax=Candidatus Saganbacteria bacterium TaxID=2575572 RepID=A0A833NSH3_UNCSA|nr:MAG: electron transport complex protein RnfG [Candidatus Saganbacteria bacterium]